MVEKIAKGIARVSGFSGYFAAVAIVLMLGLVLGEIVTRTFLSMSLLLTLELTEWLLVVTVCMGTSWTLKEDGHIRVNLFTSRLSERAQLWLTVGGAIISITFFLWFSIHAWHTLIEIYVTDVRGYSPMYHLPLWWAWVSVGLGFLLLSIQFVGVLLESVISLKRLGHERTWSSLALTLLIAVILGVFILMYNSLVLTGLSWVILLLTTLLFIFVLIGASLWICSALMVVAVVMLSIFTQYPPASIVPRIAFAAYSDFILVSIPLFIFMGELLYHSGASNTLYSGVSRWVDRIPGGLLHSNIVACTIFAAISGSSVATCATVGSVAIPELERRGYDRKVSIGTLAGAGTLGLLIPPSLMAIIYGALTGTSIGQLFIAGIVPGLMIAILFMTYIVVLAIRRPQIAPPGETHTWGQRFFGLVQILPTAITIGMVLGLIYAGISTPTESAAIGTFCALTITLAYGNLNWAVFRKSLFEAVKVTCMVEFVYIGAMLLTTSMAYLLIPQRLVETIAAMEVSRYTILGIVFFLYILLGCLFEGVSMLALTLPIIYPLIVSLGFDPLWFGVELIILIELAQITPPIGMNLFVLHGLTREPIVSIAKHALPFFIIMLFAIVMLVIFPIIPLWLPSTMMG